MNTLTGDEHFTSDGIPINRLLNDFWSWQSSDLLSNSTRGALAEYIVATAIGADTEQARDVWSDHDIAYKGLNIEVKSSSFLQSKEKNNHSRIVFTIYKSRPSTASLWDNDDISRHSDMYVFCAFACKDREIANPMCLEQWDFLVLPTTDLDNTVGNQKSISLSSLSSLPVLKCKYDNLKQTIDIVSSTIISRKESVI